MESAAHTAALRLGKSSPIAASTPSKGWPIAVLIIAAILVGRVVYLAFLSRWELVADEAHYWEWSRRPNLSYYTKGPGIAWVIWLGTTLFGDSVAAVRLPSAVVSALMALAGARLAYDVTAGNARAAWCTAVTLSLTPAYFATAQLATTDVFYSTAWMVTAWCIWHAVRPGASGSRRIAAWIAAGCAIGVGCLFKYTMLFEIAGIAAFLLARRRHIAWDRATATGMTLAGVGLLLMCSPMLIWNAQHGWPTIAHQVGRLRLPGGDESVRWQWSPLWFPTFAGAQLALLGVVGALLIFLSVRRSRSTDGSASLGRSLLLWLSVPILVFYIGLSAVRETQGNWAIAGYATLLVLVGIDAADTLRRRPRPAFQSLWHWHLGVGVIVAGVLLVGPGFTRLPGVADIDAVQRLQARISGAAPRAAKIDQLVAEITTTAARPPFILTSKYQDAGLLAFYLPGQPIVCCAASRLGSRPNAYDYFADTDLADRARLGRDAILIGGDVERWHRAFRFDSIEEVPTLPRTFIGRNYGGPIADDDTRSSTGETR